MACDKKLCLVFVALAALVVVVMVPVGICVIMPKIAQHSMDVSHLALTNSTMLPCDNFASAPYKAEVKNDLKINMLGSPIAATLQLNTIKLSVLMCPDGAGGTQAGSLCKEPDMVEIGTFAAPSTGLNLGENQVVQDVSMDITNHTTLMSGFIFPLALDPTTAQIMKVEAPDVTVKVLGIPANNLHFTRLVACKSTQYAVLDVRADKCTGRKGQVSALSMTCSPVGNGEAPASDAVRARPHASEDGKNVKTMVI